MTAGRWTPVYLPPAGERVEATYCSPGCGFQCKHSAYVEATLAAAELVLELGPGWAAQVWENLGWHWRAEAGRVDGVTGDPWRHMVRVHRSRHTGEYHAYGGGHKGTGATGRAAVADLIRHVTDDVRRMLDFLDRIPADR